MKTLFYGMLLTLGLIAQSLAQDSKPAAPMNDAETKFKDLLNNVTMKGRWTPLKDGELGEEKTDSYNIVGVSKIKDDSWVITTKMKYGGREMTLPLPITVKWAGDTAVIIVDKLAIPGGGTYSARVVFFEKTYAGSWTGERNGGLLSGVITKNAN